MTRQSPIIELTWLASFICIGLIALALLRPPPIFPAPARSRVVMDAENTKVLISLPFRGIVLTWGAWGAGGYLENTHAPETLFNVGGPLDRAFFAEEVISWIYPEVLRNDGIWDAKVMQRGYGHYVNLETLLAYNTGVYLGNGGEFGLVPLLRSVGLPALLLSRNEINWDEVCYSAAGVETALIGQPERGEALITAYKQAFADLAKELEPQSPVNNPRVLLMGSSTRDKRALYVTTESSSYQIYLRPAGVENAADQYTSQYPDAERVLAADPDIIFLVGSASSLHPQQSPQQFMRDPRWQGLKVVQDNRVYRMPGLPNGGGLGGLVFQPLWTRWMAEIAHPDRVQPKLRQVLRDTLLREFDYRISDEQIDLLLHIDENKDSVGYARFMRNAQPNNARSALP